MRRLALIVCGVVLGLLGARVAAAWTVRMADAAYADETLAVATGPGNTVAIAQVAGGRVAGSFRIVVLDGAQGAVRWTRTLGAPDCGLAQAVAIDGAGDVLAGGYLNGDCDDHSEFAVVKLDGATGQTRWQRIAMPRAAAQAVAVDAAGDVFAAGGGLVIKLDGTTGTDRWRNDAPGRQLLALVLDGHGGVVAGGWTQGTGPQGSVVRLDASTGAERWTHQVTGKAGTNERIEAVAVDPAGDVVAGGVTSDRPDDADFVVVKLAASDGAERWRWSLDGNAPDASSATPDVLTGLAVDASGNPVVAGITLNLTSGPDFTVVALDGATGAKRWRRTLKGVPPEGEAVAADAATAVTVTPDGDALATGVTVRPLTAHNLTVVRMAAADGSPYWRREIDFGGVLYPGPGDEIGRALALLPTGQVLVVGETASAGEPGRLTAVTLDPVTGILAGCGDGTVATGEQCDDGNHTSDDGCSRDCRGAGTTTTTTTTRPGNTTTTLPCAQVFCDDGDPCTTDGCEGAGVCTSVPIGALSTCRLGTFVDLALRLLDTRTAQATPALAVRLRQQLTRATRHGDRLGTVPLRRRSALQHTLERDLFRFVRGVQRGLSRGRLGAELGAELLRLAGAMCQGGPVSCDVMALAVGGTTPVVSRPSTPPGP